MVTTSIKFNCLSPSVKLILKFAGFGKDYALFEYFKK